MPAFEVEVVPPLLPQRQARLGPLYQRVEKLSANVAGASLGVVPQLLLNQGNDAEEVPAAYLHTDCYSTDSQVQAVVRTSEDAWHALRVQGRAV